MGEARETPGGATTEGHNPGGALGRPVFEGGALGGPAVRRQTETGSCIHATEQPWKTKTEAGLELGTAGTSSQPHPSPPPLIHCPEAVTPKDTGDSQEARGEGINRESRQFAHTRFNSLTPWHLPPMKRPIPRK